MRVALFVAALVGVGDPAVHAEVLQSITARGDALSSLYGISRVNEASTPTEEVRVYTLSAGEDLSRETLVLRMAAAGRPYRMAFDVLLWDLGDVLASVESVAVSNDIVTIKGSSNSGSRECRYAFGFTEGRLSKELDALGCESK